MLGRDRADDIMNATVYDRSGDKIGAVERVYLDDTSGDPAWVSVRSGLFVSKERFVPLDEATLEDNRLVVAVTSEAVKDSPDVDLEDGRLGKPQAAQLRTHFGLAPSGAPMPTGDVAPEPVSPPVSAPPATPGPGTEHPSPSTVSTPPVAPPPADPPTPVAARGPVAAPAPAPDDAPTAPSPGTDAETSEDHQGLRLVRKVYVEEQQITVPVVREEYVLEGEPELNEARQEETPDS